MRDLCGVVLLLLVAALVGCGAEEPKAVETAPFEAALVEYLRVGSMDMKPEKFESIKISGNEATAKVRMTTKGELGYGLKPLWTVTFKKAKDTWKVVRWAAAR